jgi:hypothetical protein
MSSRAGLLVRGAFCLLVTFVLLNTRLVPLGGVPPSGPGSDHGLLTWGQWWVTESVLHLRNPYWTSLLYHPTGAGLASHTLGPGFFPVGLLTKAALGGDPAYPACALSLSIGLCFALGTLLACEAFRSLGAGTLPALAAATGWAFSAALRVMAGNPTLASAAFLLPAVTLAVAALVRAPSPGRAMVLGGVAGACVYFSEYFSAFIALGLVLAVLACLLWADTREALRALRRALGIRGLALALGACLIVAAPFVVNWVGTEGRPPKERQIQAGGANLAGFLVPSPGITPMYRGRILGRLSARVTRGSLIFLGFPTLLLAALGSARSDRRLSRILLVIGFVFLGLSLGPTLRVLGTATGVPLPYAALRHLPPFHMAREPERLTVLGVWALFVLAALGLTAAAEAVARSTRLIPGGAVAVMAFAWWAAEGYCPQPRSVAYRPPTELGQLPPGAVANLPLGIRDGLAMFLQVFHGRPIVTGYVSRSSPQQFAQVERLQGLLDAGPNEFVAEMRRLGVGTVILQPGTPPPVAEALLGHDLAVLDLRAAEGPPSRD